MAMFDHDETVQAVNSFYRLLVSLAYPDESLLKLPPADGWDDLNLDELRKLGKNDTVVSLLKHLPYISHGDSVSPPLVYYETIPRDYTASWGWHDEVYPVPSHCVYLTESVDVMGYSLILDTERGTITEYTIQGFHITIPWAEEEAMPEREKWRAHRTTPVVEFFTKWEIRLNNLIWMLVPFPFFGPTSGRFYNRTVGESAEEELIGRGLVEWSPSHEERSRLPNREWAHVKAIYDTFLRNGWPTSFKKETCRAELIELERRKHGIQVSESKVRKATGGPVPRRPVETTEAKRIADPANE